MRIEFKATIFNWRGPSPYFFVTGPAEESDYLKSLSGAVTYGWGVIPVHVQIAFQFAHSRLLFVQRSHKAAVLLLIQGRLQSSATAAGSETGKIVDIGIPLIQLKDADRTAEQAAALVPGFQISGFGAAFLGSLLFTVLNLLIDWLAPKD